MKEEKESRGEIWEQTTKQVATWMEGIHKTLYNPATLNVALYVITNPRCKKDNIIRNLESKYDVSRIEQSYKALTSCDLSTIPLPILRENKDGTVEFMSHGSGDLRFFAGTYKIFGKQWEEELLNKFISEGEIDMRPVDFKSRVYFEGIPEKEKTQIKVKVGMRVYQMFRETMLSDRAEIETTLQEIGKHLRWMPKEKEVEILKQNTNTVRFHLSNLGKILYSAVEDSYREIPFSVSEYTDIEELRKRFSLDESRFLWDVGRRLNSIDRLLKETNEVSEYGYRTILQCAGDAYDCITVHFPDAVETAEERSNDFIEKIRRVREGKHYFTPEEWSSRNKRERIRQILLRPKYSENGKTLAYKLLDSSDKIKKEMIGIAKTQKNAYDTLPVGTLH